MKKVLILDKDYPSPTNLYGDVFVHNRVKEYKNFVEVNVISFFRSQKDYEYEGVNVKHLTNVQELIEEYQSYKPDVVFIHFYDFNLFEFIKQINVPIYVWVHGHEALGWYRRLFNYNIHFLIRSLPRLMVSNFKQMYNFHKLIKYSNTTRKINFVFVSNWMKKITELDAFIRINNYSIIPNPVNTSLFKFKEKDLEHRKRILLLRPFHSKKYANDIAIDAILKLKRKKYFNELTFHIYGLGAYYQKLTKPLQDLPNVKLHNYFVANTKMPILFDNFGILLIPTRQDAQGVTMCEGMACGLVPITSNNTAIPEFVKNKVSGFLTNNADEIVESIDYLYNHPIEFKRISFSASKMIIEKCGSGKIIKEELNFIEL